MVKLMKPHLYRAISNVVTCPVTTGELAINEDLLKSAPSCHSSSSEVALCKRVKIMLIMDDSQITSALKRCHIT